MARSLPAASETSRRGQSKILCWRCSLRWIHAVGPRLTNDAGDHRIECRAGACRRATVHWKNGSPTSGGPTSDCIVSAEMGKHPQAITKGLANFGRVAGVIGRTAHRGAGGDAGSHDTPNVTRAMGPPNRRPRPSRVKTRRLLGLPPKCMAHLFHTR
jgi:hypothetical protein